MLRVWVVYGLLCVCVGWTAHAQDAGGVGVEYTMPVPLADVDPRNPDLQMSLVTYYVNAGYPFVFESSDTVFIVGLNYRGTSTIIDNAPTDLIDDFHEVGPVLGSVDTGYKRGVLTKLAV